jgi:hypothetical protein
MTTEQPTLPLTTAEGEPLALPPAQAWREHTAERWKERDPESYAFAIYLVRELGLTNKSEIERLVREHREARHLPGISRNSIIAMFHDQQEFKPGEIDEIIRRRSALLSADALDKIEELLYKAKAAKDLGAAAMALTAVYNVKQLSHGGATRISGSTDEGKKAKTFDDFMKLARDKMKEQPLPLHEPSVEVEVLPVAVADGRQINDKADSPANPKT